MSGACVCFLVYGLLHVFYLQYNTGFPGKEISSSNTEIKLPPSTQSVLEKALTSKSKARVNDIRTSTVTHSGHSGDQNINGNNKLHDDNPFDVQMEDYGVTKEQPKLNTNIVDDHPAWPAFPDYTGESIPFLFDMVYNNSLTAIEAMYNVCPNLQTCSESIKTYNGPSCCLECDCSDKCLVLSNCCHDKYENSQNKGPSVPTNAETCQYTLITRDGTDKTFLKNAKQNLFPYLLVDTCPLTTENITLLDKCTLPEFTVDGSTPVYSNVTDLNYANINCAICNGVKEDELQKWTIEIECFKPENIILFLSSDFINFEKLPLDCLILFTPNPNFNFHKCLIYKDIVSECPDQHTDKHYEAIRSAIDTEKYGKLSDLCTKEDHFVPITYRRLVYRNMYCLYCNTFSPSCVSEHPFEKTSFTAVLDYFDRSTDNNIENPLRKSDISSVECEDIESLDNSVTCDNKMPPKMADCIVKRCGINMVMAGGRCLPILTEVYGITFDYRLKISYAIDQNIMITYENALKFTREFLRNGIENVRYCYIEIVSYEVRNMRMVFHVKAAYSVEINTNIEVSFYEFKKRMNNYLNLIVEFDDIQLNDIKDYEDPKFTNFVDVDAISMKTCQYPSSIAMSELLFCDSVLFLASNSTLVRDGLLVSIKNYRFVLGLSQFVMKTTLFHEEVLVYVQMCLNVFLSKTGLEGTHNVAETSSVLNPVVLALSLVISVFDY